MRNGMIQKLLAMTVSTSLLVSGLSVPAFGATQDNGSQAVFEEVVTPNDGSEVISENRAEQESEDLMEAESEIEMALEFPAGGGTPENPYQISNAAEFLRFLYQSKNSATYYILTSDIDFANKTLPSDARVQDYKGGFDGDGHTIKNLKVNHNTWSIFESIKSTSVIKNVTFENTDCRIKTRYNEYQTMALFQNVNGTLSNIVFKNIIGNGSTQLIQNVNETGKVENCRFEGTVTVENDVDRSNYFEGFIGTNSGIIKGCISSAKIVTTNGKGFVHEYGLLYQNGGLVEDCHRTESLLGAEMAAGICKTNYGGIMKGCTTAKGITIEGNNINGSAGIVYEVGNYGCTSIVEDCVNNATVVGKAVAGIVYNVVVPPLEDEWEDPAQSIVRGCVNNGTITGEKLGGIAFHATGEITGCKNYGKLVPKQIDKSSYESYAGGIVANADEKYNLKLVISDCVNYADLAATSSSSGNVGGIVGLMSRGERSISRCGNFGTLTGSNPGGIVGLYDVPYDREKPGPDTLTITECFNYGDIRSGGGLIGYLQAPNVTLKDCFTATRTKSLSAGGDLIGGSYYSRNDKTIHLDIENCYTHCKIPGTSHGELLGRVSSGTIIAVNARYCYVLDNGGNLSVQNLVAFPDGAVKKCSESQMKTQDTYTGFDFGATWNMRSGSYPYPMLSWIEDDFDNIPGSSEDPSDPVIDPDKPVITLTTLSLSGVKNGTASVPFLGSKSYSFVVNRGAKLSEIGIKPAVTNATTVVNEAAGTISSDGLLIQKGEGGITVTAGDFAKEGTSFALEFYSLEDPTKKAISKVNFVVGSPSWKKAKPTVKLISATDTMVKVSLAMPKLSKSEAESGMYVYRVNITPNNAFEPGFIGEGEQYVIAAPGNNIFSMKVLDGEYGEGHAAKFKISAQLIRLCDKDEDIDSNNRSAISAAAVLSAATKEPSYTKSLKFKLASKKFYAGDTDVLFGTAVLDKKATYDRTTDWGIFEGNAAELSEAGIEFSYDDDNSLGMKVSIGDDVLPGKYTVKFWSGESENAEKVVKATAVLTVANTATSFKEDTVADIEIPFTGRSASAKVTPVVYGQGDDDHRTVVKKCPISYAIGTMDGDTLVPNKCVTVKKGKITVSKSYLFPEGEDQEEFVLRIKATAGRSITKDIRVTIKK